MLVNLISKFENDFDAIKARDWFSKHAKSYAFLACGFYLASIFLIQQIMKRRQPFNLKKLLILWNLSLSMFSFLGAAKCVREFSRLFKLGGLRLTICDNTYYAEGDCCFWIMAYTFSKLPELVDTYFIVLRKKKLIFLHYYHHATVLLYCWLSYEYWFPSAIWYTSMNYWRGAKTQTIE